jgi:hypothetical protein
MLISALGNVKQAIGDVLIELEEDAHQIQYKPTQQKNSKAKKMLPGVPSGLCNEGIMCSIRHGLKTCEKTLCNAKSLPSKQIWIVIIYPPRYEWIFQAGNPPQKQSAIWKVVNIPSTN